VRELDKWADAQTEMTVILYFLDWLEAQRMEIAVPRETGNWLRPITESRTEMLYRYFKINAVKLEHERRALISPQR